MHATASLSGFLNGRTVPDETIPELICKLRWMSRDDEACELERVLREIPLTERGSFLAEPTNTD